MTQSGIEPATFRILTQFVNKMLHRVTRQQQVVYNLYNEFLIFTKCFNLKLWFFRLIVKNSLIKRNLMHTVVLKAISN